MSKVNSISSCSSFWYSDSLSSLVEISNVIFSAGPTRNSPQTKVATPNTIQTILTNPPRADDVVQRKGPRPFDLDDESSASGAASGDEDFEDEKRAKKKKPGKKVRKADGDAAPRKARKRKRQPEPTPEELEQMDPAQGAHASETPGQQTLTPFI
jgi:hypothetical protein